MFLINESNIFLTILLILFSISVSHDCLSAHLLSTLYPSSIHTFSQAGAAFDVFPKEPATGESFESELRGLPNVILTPHVGTVHFARVFFRPLCWSRNIAFV